ncbi:hypothetical protein NFI96_013046, partial [Prochilodus magdalenae]
MFLKTVMPVECKECSSKKPPSALPLGPAPWKTETSPSTGNHGREQRENIAVSSDIQVLFSTFDKLSQLHCLKNIKSIGTYRSLVSITPPKPGQIRVVFDSSAKCGGIILNDILLSGPDTYNTLPGVL